MELKFLIIGEIDLIATYAAILSTVLGVWEFLKWKSRNSIILKCSPNMLIMPSSDKKKYINATVTNTGQQATTVTHLLIYYWETLFDRLLDKNRQSFFVTTPQVPKVIQPGEQWMAQAIQDDNLEKMAVDGYLYVGIIHSMRRKEVMQRVKITKKN